MLPVELLEPPLWQVSALLFGLLVGSFANVCIHRLPLEQSIIDPPSHCPACGARIRPWDNVPVLSWLVLRGRCRDCRAPISPRYPAVEAVNGLLWLAVASVHGPAPRTVVLLAFASALFILAVIDLEHKLLPNVITRPGILVGIATALAAAQVPEFDARTTELAFPGPREAVAAALGGYLVFAAVAWAALRWYGEEALGQGDWKLAAMLGAFLGVRGLLLTVLLATLSGSVVGIAIMARGGGRRAKVPLGTFLGAAGILVLLSGGDLWGFYLRAFWPPR